MIHDPEKMFDLFIGKRMVQCGCEVQNNQGSAIDAEAHNLPGISVLNGKDHQQYQGSNGKCCTDTVGNAVGNLFSQAIAPGNGILDIFISWG